jgi:aspartyl/asparaginyl beta-hydroxylase (cupin superfamily)
MCANFSRHFESHLTGTLAKAGFDPATASRRFAQAVDLLLSRKQVFLQSPQAFYFPELPNRQFYERAEFPWLTALEARTGDIRAELLSIIQDGGAQAFQPYVKTKADRPIREFGRLRDNPEWSAFYLIEGGRVVPEAVARCPATMAALASTPLCETPGRTPSVLFSLLRPGARIPPHTGYTNARLICHLPLIVPPGCALRVGNETRPWVEGEALVFDDSIEHEAWNASGDLRVVLLFDIWRPELSAQERTLIAATLAAVGSYDSAPWV